MKFITVTSPGLLPVAASPLSPHSVLRLAEPQSAFEPTSANPARTSSGCRPRRRWSTRCSTWRKVTPSDFVMDLGSGDGRTVITAAKRGAKALGIEYNPDMVELSRRNAKAAGIGERATFTQADLFATDFSKATVITMFLLPSINIKLQPKILEMRPGTRVVSNSFDMGDWRPEQTVEAVERLHAPIAARISGSCRRRSRAPGSCPTANCGWSRPTRRCSARCASATRPCNISNGKVIGDRSSFSRRRRPLHRPRQRQRHRGHQPNFERLESDAIADWRAPVACDRPPYPFVCPSTDQRPAPATG